MNRRDKIYTSDVIRSWNLFQGTSYGGSASTKQEGLKGVGQGSGVAGGGKPAMQVNYGVAVVSTKYTSITFNNPGIVCEPQNDAAQGFADVARLALQYYWHKSEVQQEVKLAFLDRLVAGLGVVYVGWEFESEKGDGQGPYHLEGGRLPVEGDTPDEDRGEEGEDESPIKKPIKRDKRLKDQPLVRRLDPLMFWVSPEAVHNLNRAAYCGYTELVPISELKRDPRYKNTRGLKGSADNLRGYLDESNAQLPDEDLRDDLKRVRLHHYFERSRRIHVVIADEEGHDSPLLVEDWPWEFDGYPFAVVHGIPRPSEFWPLSDLLYVESPIREVEQVRALQARMVRMGVPKVVITGQPLDPQQRTQLKSDVPYTALELRQGQAAMFPQLPQNSIDIGATVQAARQDIETIAGLSQYDFASMPQKRATAGEVEAVQNAGGGRVQADRQSFESFCGTVAQRMLDLLMQYHTQVTDLPIYDRDDKVSSFTRFTGLDIRGEFRVKVAIGSTTAPNDADAIQAAAFLLQSIGPFIQAMPVAMQMGLDLRRVIISVIKHIPGLRDVQDIIAPLETQLHAQEMARSTAGPGMPPGLPPGPPGAMGAPMLPPSPPAPMVPGAPAQPPGPAGPLPPQLLALMGNGAGGVRPF